MRKYFLSLLLAAAALVATMATVAADGWPSCC